MNCPMNETEKEFMKDIEDRLKMIEKAINKLHDHIEELQLKVTYDREEIWNYDWMKTGKHL